MSRKLRLLYVAVQPVVVWDETAIAAASWMSWSQARLRLENF